MPIEIAGPATINFDRGRRSFVRTLGLGTLGTAVFGAMGSRPAVALTSVEYTDVDIQTFLLNLEYLGAEFYLRASVGQGLNDAEVTGTGTLGPVQGGRQVNFETSYLRNFANELAVDERAHVHALRASLGSDAIARPAIDLSEAFVLAAQQAGLVGPNETFDPFANESNFLLAAFMLEDVCVTALTGAMPAISSKAVLATAAGFLGVESYQAGAIRTFLAARGYFTQTGKISDARDANDGIGTDDDQGIGDGVTINITPTDSNGLAYARTPNQLLQIIYLGQGQRSGFFPNGINGYPELRPLYINP